MSNLLVALVIVIGGWWLLRKFANSQPAQVRDLVRKLSGWGVLALAGILTMRGGFNIAMPLFALGAGLLGQNALFPNGMPWARKSPGQTSRVSTSLLAMELDHDSGHMDGSVLAGAFKGRRLSGLSLNEARQLHAECSATTDQSRALFEAWIERSHPEWRQQWGGSRSHASAPPTAKMSRAEALAILGLKDGANSEEVKAAHRRLMKTAHPDLGGSDYLAAKINEAKEHLLQPGA